MRKIYIAGKITGEDKYEVIRKFELIESKLKEDGSIVVSPLKNGLQWNVSREEHLITDFNLIIGCDSIFFMRDWRQSSGCQLEYRLAIELKKKIVFEVDPMHVELCNAIERITLVQFTDMCSKRSDTATVFARFIFVHIALLQGHTVQSVSEALQHGRTTILYYSGAYDKEYETNIQFKGSADAVIEILKRK